MEESNQVKKELDQIEARKNLYINDFFDELTRDIDVDIETYLVESLTTPSQSERANGLRDDFLKLIQSEKSCCLANANQVLVRDWKKHDSSYSAASDASPASVSTLDQILYETKRSLFCSNSLLYVKSASPSQQLGYLIFIEGFYLNNKEVNFIRYARLFASSKA